MNKLILFQKVVKETRERKLLQKKSFHKVKKNVKGFAARGFGILTK